MRDEIQILYNKYLREKDIATSLSAQKKKYLLADAYIDGLSLITKEIISQYYDTVDTCNELKRQLSCMLKGKICRLDTTFIYHDDMSGLIELEEIK